MRSMERYNRDLLKAREQSTFKGISSGETGMDEPIIPIGTKKMEENKVSKSLNIILG